MNHIKIPLVRLKLIRDAVWREWIVAYQEWNGTQYVTNVDKSYYSDDKQDAKDTLKQMQKDLDQKASFRRDRIDQLGDHLNISLSKKGAKNETTVKHTGDS